MNYDEARAEIQASRESTYGSQWIRHLDRYGPVAYFYEMAGIMGRLESLIVDYSVAPPEVSSEALDEVVLDKLLDLGNYASFIYDWMQTQKAQIDLQLFKDTLP